MASETIETIETIADIVAEIRAYGAQPPPRLMWLEIADRLESAWKRERQPLTIAEWIDKTETVADIVAVLRRYVLPSLAERLEAAAKRERAKIEADALAVGGIVESARQKPVGNAAAMREALVKLREIANVAFEKKMREGVETVNLPQAIWYWCGKALSAPARNCERFATWNEARIYWLRHSPKAMSCKGGTIGFLDWLFDLYTEEGGANGKA